jgi:anti-sigma B factor antagonist
MPLDIQSSTSDETLLIAVKGEVDLYTSPELRTSIMNAIPTASRQVAVDLSGVVYMDSSGVATLVEGLKSAREHSTSFKLVAPSAPVMKVLSLAKLDGLFEVGPEP